MSRPSKVPATTVSAESQMVPHRPSRYIGQYFSSSPKILLIALHLLLFLCLIKVSFHKVRADHIRPYVRFHNG